MALGGGIVGPDDLKDPIRAQLEANSIPGPAAGAVNYLGAAPTHVYHGRGRARGHVKGGPAQVAEARLSLAGQDPKLLAGALPDLVPEARAVAGVADRLGSNHSHPFGPILASLLDQAADQFDGLMEKRGTQVVAGRHPPS